MRQAAPRRTQKTLSSLLYLWLALCILTPFLPGSWLIHNFFGYAPPIILVAPVLFFVFGTLVRVLIKRTNRLDFVNLIVGTISSFIIVGFQIPLPMSAPNGQTIRVLTTNVEFHNREVPGLHEFISSRGVDIVMMQEVKGEATSPAAKLAKEFPGWHLTTVSELAILSRWPISEVEKTPLPSQPGRYILACTVAAPKPFRAITTHWTVPQISRGYAGLQDTLKTQMQDYRDTIWVLQRQKLPLILGGDFNNPPRHTFSRLLSDHMEDAFSSSGFGPGWTYPSSKPVVRIDHLFSSSMIRPIKAEVGPAFGSDHRSLFAEFRCLD